MAEGRNGSNKNIELKRLPCQREHSFSVGDYVVYPAHGLGKVTAVECREVAGQHLELFVIEFEQERMVLRIPPAKIKAAGLRPLSDQATVTRAFEILQSAPSGRRGMWSRRTQIYEGKINSGALLPWAEVLRDLYRSEDMPDPSYSERQIYDLALDRLQREVAAVRQIPLKKARQDIEMALATSSPASRSVRKTTSIQAA